MENKVLKRAIASVMAFAISGGAAVANSAYLFGSTSVVKAEENIIDEYDHENDPDHLDSFDPASFSEKTGVLLLNGKVNKNDVKQYNKNENVKKVSCAKGTVFPEDCSTMFEQYYAKEFDFTNADLSNVDNMSNMFYLLNSGDAKIINLKASKATKMNFMFYNSPTLKSLELSGWDTSNVKSMNGAFMDCTNLESLDLGGLNTSNVEDMGNMFEDCYKLPSIDVSSFDTSKVKYMYNMFIYCQSLKTIDVSNFDTSNVEAMQSMFSHCTSLESIDVSNLDTSKARETYDYTSSMFLDCPALIPNMVFNFGANITLDGSLGVNFYVNQPEYYSKYYSGDLGQLSKNLEKIVLSGPNGDIVITDFEKYDTNTQTMKLTYPVNATQANEKITLKAYDKDGNRLVVCNQGYELCSHSQLECSVQSYIDELKKTTNIADAKLKILVGYLENYCKAADNYFNGTKNDVIEYLDIYKPMFNMFATKLPDDVKISLVLNSETALRIYTDSIDVFIDGVKAEAKSKNDMQYYEIPNIAAHRLSTSHEITIDGKKYNCSALSYGYRVVDNNTDSKLKDVAWALYSYSLAADAYVA